MAGRPSHRAALAQIVGGSLTVGGLSILIGATAPSWPQRWLEKDRGPLRLLSWESQSGYERVGVRRFKKILPEAGALFGGKSKSVLPRLTDPQDVEAYIREARRGEYVHWLSNLTWVPMLAFADRRIVAVFAGITFTVNSVAISILRYNRIRLYQVLSSTDQ